MGPPGWVSVGEDVPSFAGTRCPRVGWYPREAPPYLTRREEKMREAFVRVGLEVEGGGFLCVTFLNIAMAVLELTL